MIMVEIFAKAQIVADVPAADVVPKRFGSELCEFGDLVDVFFEF